MLKRKIPDYDAPDSSIFGDVPARNKRLFRRKDSCRQRWTPQQQNIMPELLEYILQHEEAFKNQHRLASLFADFQQQREINPDGYHANIAAWTKALSNAARAGVIPGQGTTHDLTVVRTADELARALQHPQYGKPAGLPAVFHEAVQRKEMVLVKEFMSSTTSIYKTSWIPTPWSALQWSLRTVGVLGKAAPPDKLAVRNYVVLKNVEVAGDEILKKMKECTSTADRVLSRRDFLNRFSHMLNPASPLTNNDLNIILIHLCRDKQAISYDAQTIKFKAEHEAEPLPITEEDAAIVGLRDTLANIHAQLPPLMEKIELANAAAREAVATKQMVRAKAALRSKKLAETALAQRSDVALQLEGVYHQLQQAADQVEIVEAMRAGAAALKGLNEKVGGAEGVQGVVDAVNEQMAATEDITNIINETDTAIDEVDVEDEFEALERAEKERKEQEEAAKTAARLAQLEEAERKQKKKQAKEQQAKEQQAKKDAVQQDKQTEDEVVEEEVEQASQSIAQISFIDQGEEEWEREPAYA